jgi:hypothetical protein
MPSPHPGSIAKRLDERVRLHPTYVFRPLSSPLGEFSSPSRTHSNRAIGLGAALKDLYQTVVKLEAELQGPKLQILSFEAYDDSKAAHPFSDGLCTEREEWQARIETHRRYVQELFLAASRKR